MNNLTKAKLALEIIEAKKEKNKIPRPERIKKWKDSLKCIRKDFDKANGDDEEWYDWLTDTFDLLDDAEQFIHEYEIEEAKSKKSIIEVIKEIKEMNNSIKNIN